MNHAKVSELLVPSVAQVTPPTLPHPQSIDCEISLRFPPKKSSSSSSILSSPLFFSLGSAHMRRTHRPRGARWKGWPRSVSQSLRLTLRRRTDVNFLTLAPDAAAAPSRESRVLLQREKKQRLGCVKSLPSAARLSEDAGTTQPCHHLSSNEVNDGARLRGEGKGEDNTSRMGGSFRSS